MARRNEAYVRDAHTFPKPTRERLHACPCANAIQLWAMARSHCLPTKCAAAPMPLCQSLQRGREVPQLLHTPSLASVALARAPPQGVSSGHAPPRQHLTAMSGALRWRAEYGQWWRCGGVAVEKRTRACTRRCGTIGE